MNRYIKAKQKSTKMPAKDEEKWTMTKDREHWWRMGEGGGNEKSEKKETYTSKKKKMETW